VRISALAESQLKRAMDPRVQRAINVKKAQDARMARFAVPVNLNKARCDAWGEMQRIDNDIQWASTEEKKAQLRLDVIEAYKDMRKTALVCVTGQDGLLRSRKEVFGITDAQWTKANADVVEYIARHERSLHEDKYIKRYVGLLGSFLHDHLDVNAYNKGTDPYVWYMWPSHAITDAEIEATFAQGLTWTKESVGRILRLTSVHRLDEKSAITDDDYDASNDECITNERRETKEHPGREMIMRGAFESIVGKLPAYAKVFIDESAKIEARKRNALDEPDTGNKRAKAAH
jgi:hypothetical protein